MKKSDALKYFNEIVKPEIVRRYGQDDKVALRCAWNDYVDVLQKDDDITEHQANNWSNPF